MSFSNCNLVVGKTIQAYGKETHGQRRCYDIYLYEWVCGVTMSGKELGPKDNDVGIFPIRNIKPQEPRHTS